MHYPLNPNVYNDDVQLEPIRAGFGRGLLAAGKTNDAIVALCADLTDSTQMSLFKNEFPNRFVEIGVAEQNLVTVASGMARAGKIPFTSSYAAFSPGRNWEQIRAWAADLPARLQPATSAVVVAARPAGREGDRDVALHH